METTFERSFSAGTDHAAPTEYEAAAGRLMYGKHQPVYQGHLIVMDAPIHANNCGLNNRVDIFNGSECIKCFLYRRGGASKALAKCYKYIDALPAAPAVAVAVAPASHAGYVAHKGQAVIYEAAAADLDASRGKYAISCDIHSNLGHAKTLKSATAQMNCPALFCDDCRTAAKNI